MCNCCGFKFDSGVVSLLLSMVLQSTLSNLLQRLDTAAASEHPQLLETVQRISAASAVLTASPSRQRVQNVRHLCREWSIPVRVGARGSFRLLKDLSDDLFAVLFRNASDVLSNVQGSVAQHLVFETKIDGAESEQVASKRSRKQKHSVIVECVAAGSVEQAFVDVVNGLEDGLVAVSGQQAAAADVTIDFCDDPFDFFRVTEHPLSSGSIASEHPLISVSSASERLSMKKKRDCEDVELGVSKRLQRQVPKDCADNSVVCVRFVSCCRLGVYKSIVGSLSLLVYLL